MSRLPPLPPTPAAHFRLHLYGAVLRLRDRLPQLEEVEFLRPYYQELEEAGFPRGADPGHWWRSLLAWERDVPGHLPLRALRTAAGLDDAALALLFAVGLPEEDSRFGVLFEALDVAGGGRRPSAGLVGTWDAAFRPALRRLLRLGAIEPANPEVPRSEWVLQVATPLWDALRGDLVEDPAPWGRHLAPESLPDPSGLVLEPELETAFAALPSLLSRERTLPVAVRGPRGSGRRTLLRALARALGLGVLEVRDPVAAGSLAGPLATALGAMPMLALEPGPGETAEVPSLDAYTGPVGLAMGRRGGLGGPGAEGAVVLELAIPAPDARLRHWEDALGGSPPAGLVEAMRATGGAIRRMAAGARAQAALAGRNEPTVDDVRAASRLLSAQALDGLATRLPARGLPPLVTSHEVGRELELLERRCRHREALAGAADGAGVRVLLTGPSGTGKTLAARRLGAALDKDVYSLDVATVVDKYLGETEKRLEAALSRAEELDVILLLDEGDALLSTRTDVRTSNDRYANLETNYLLARVETFEGILVVTTNAGDRIDAAFRRRIDVVVDFRAPDAAARWEIWCRHLPDGHAVPEAFLDDLAARCELTGGQIRNAVLHAALLALDAGGLLDDGHLEEAVRREYRKAGAICPLRERVHG